jgi:BlaI family penicillinase repressor
MTHQRLTKFELEVMDVLWDSGALSVRELMEKLPSTRRPAYTTVQTIVNRLEEKGALRRTRKIGNAFLFEAVLARRAAYQRVLDDFLELFGGSARPLVAHLMESGKLTLADLKALEKAAEGPLKHRRDEKGPREK